MPLDDLFDEDAAPAVSVDRRKAIFEAFGVLTNPFPSAAQTSGNPHRPTDADEHIDNAVKTFYHDRKSHAIAVTATQGIGKTNLLNAYETALREKLSARGFFVIRYIADPEPTFDPLLRSVFEHMGEDHIESVAQAMSRLDNDEAASRLEAIRTADVQAVVRTLADAVDDPESIEHLVGLAHQWFLGLPVRKAHREGLGVQFRLDTVESKTRALRDMVYLSADLKVLEGVFLLLDELEKQDFSRSKTVVLQYLSSLRALIDALPRNLFLMMALTTDALQRYQEMLPALKGRLADRVDLRPIETESEAVDYRDFYLKYAKEEAARVASPHRWKSGHRDLVSDLFVHKVFDELESASYIQGVRQRDFLNELHRKAQSEIDKVVS